MQIVKSTEPNCNDDFIINYYRYVRFGAFYVSCTEAASFNYWQ